MNIKKTSCGKWNFWSMFVEGGFYFTGYTFFDVLVVIPVFVDAMTGDLRLAGLAATLKSMFFIIPQLFMGHITPKVKNVPRFLGIVGLAARAMYLMVPVMLLTGINPYLTVMVLYLALLVGSFGDGITHVPWLDIFGRTILPENRGKLLGMQMLLGGIGGLTAGSLIKYILAGKGPSLNEKYALIFLLGAVALTVSGILLFTLGDVERSTSTGGQSMITYLKGLHRYITTNKKYIRFITTQALAYFGGLAAPLYILFAKNHFSLGDGMVTTLMFVQISGGLAGGVIWGALSHKLGNKLTIQTGILLNLFIAAIAAGLVFISGPTVVPLLTFIVFGAGILTGSWLGYTNYLLELVSEEERPVYLAITATIQFPFTFISFLGGILANYIGFLGVFVIVAAFMALTFAASRRLERIS